MKDKDMNMKQLICLFFASSATMAALCFKVVNHGQEPISIVTETTSSGRSETVLKKGESVTLPESVISFAIKTKYAGTQESTVGITMTGYSAEQRSSDDFVFQVNGEHGVNLFWKGAKIPVRLQKESKHSDASAGAGVGAGAGAPSLADQYRAGISQRSASVKQPAYPSTQQEQPKLAQNALLHQAAQLSTAGGADKKQESQEVVTLRAENAQLKAEVARLTQANAQLQQQLQKIRVAIGM